MKAFTLPGLAPANIPCKHVRAVGPILALALGAAIVPDPGFAAPSLTTLWTFTGGADGSYPYYSSLLAGPNGSLFGTTAGGTTGLGTAFQLLPPEAIGRKWTLLPLHSFTGGADGGRPSAMVRDDAGNLYGAAEIGGDLSCKLVPAEPGCGVIFELSPPAAGGAAWTETVLFTFSGADGAFPQAGLVRDAAGNLFGTTVQSAPCFPKGCGVVFELSPPQAGQTKWTETTLYRFDTEQDGVVPQGIPVLDAAGALYGVTESGGIQSRPACGSYGQCGYGTVYKLTPPAQPGGQWTKTTLWAFNGANGSYPQSVLHLDAAGNVYGLTEFGGLKGPCPYPNKQYQGCGTAFKLSPPSSGQGAYALSTVWQFTGLLDGRYPVGAGLSPVLAGGIASGIEYLTTTSGDETHDFGSIDLFVPAPYCPPSPPVRGLDACPLVRRPGISPPVWKEITLFTFKNDANGENPASELLQVGNVFYGETAGQRGTPNGPAAYGTIFSFTP